MRKYKGVHRHREAEYLAASIERGGGRLLGDIDPTVAPFELRTLAPSGEIFDLVCYVFYANKYRQGNRPLDEHRFQVKYGSDFKSYHEIYIDPTGRRITLLLGVHLEEDILVAVDPAMHNPTRFSRSVEFKDAHVEATQQKGWHGWERERSSTRRRIELPLESHLTEALVGIRPERFFDYVSLERLTTGLGPGIRLTLAERIFSSRPSRHPLEREFKLPAYRLLDLVDGRFRLKAAVRGGVAEEHLRNLLSEMSDIDELRRLDLDGRPDFEVVFRGRPPISIECKNVLRHLTKGLPKVDFQKTRASKKDPCSRYYRPSDFQVLAACLFPVRERWEFAFTATRDLEPHKMCRGRLSQNVLVGNSGWTESVAEILERVTSV